MGTETVVDDLKGNLRVGADFVDAVAPSAVRSHGRVTVNGGVREREYAWSSSLDCVASERVLRGVIEREGARIVRLVSQGVCGVLTGRG